MTRPRTLLLAGLALVAVGTWLASPIAAGERRRGRHHGPPPIAFEVCEELSAGDSCSFENRRGRTLEGTCQERRERAICVPEGHRFGSRHGRGGQGGRGVEDEVVPEDDVDLEEDEQDEAA